MSIIKPTSENSEPTSAPRRTTKNDAGVEAAMTPDRPQSLSRFALRDDGALLLSLEDAEARDVEGREVIRFLVLTAEESERAKETAEHAFATAAAKAIARLPKRAK